MRVTDLSEFRSWATGFDPPREAHDFLRSQLSTARATALLEVMFPLLVLVDDCVLLESAYEPANFAQWMAHLNSDRSAVEKTINHLHMWDLFDPADDLDEQALLQLARRVNSTWAIHLVETFPDRSFEISVDPDDYGPTVTMCTRRSADDSPARRG